MGYEVIIPRSLDSESSISSSREVYRHGDIRRSPPDPKGLEGCQVSHIEVGIPLLRLTSNADLPSRRLAWFYVTNLHKLHGRAMQKPHQSFYAAPVIIISTVVASLLSDRVRAVGIPHIRLPSHPFDSSHLRHS